MSAYATHDEVAAEFKGLTAAGGFGASGSTISTTQVTDWCERASRVIDGKIAGKYAVPVDQTASPGSFAILKEICIWLVKHKVQSVLTTATGDPKTSSGQAIDWTKKAMDALKEITEGTTQLYDAATSTSADGVESYTDLNSDTTQPPTFRKGEDNW